MTPIPISPLQLKSHFFHSIRLQAIPGGKKDAATDINREIAFSPLPQNPKDWQLELTVKLSSTDKAKPFVYELEVHAIGVFELVAELPEDRKQQLIVVNGLSILYGAIREMVINMTARSAYGAVSLPSISFTDVLNEVKPKGGSEQPVAAPTPPTAGNNP